MTKVEQIDKDWVRQRVFDITKVSNDSERAHVAEDILYRDILRAIAEGRCADPTMCATEALKACLIEFRRAYGGSSY